MKRADMHAEIRELRTQRSKLIRHCVDLRATWASANGVDPTPAKEEERLWISKTILRPGEKL